MLNYIWSAMILTAVILGAVTGNLEAVANSAVEGAQTAVNMSISLLGGMCMWCGLMRIAKECDVTGMFAKFLTPVTNILFPDIKKNGAAKEAIVMSMVANLFGMSSAATPLGIYKRTFTN